MISTETLKNETHICTACGSKVSPRWERLTPGLCRTLIKFYMAICAAGKNEAHLQECDLSKSEYNNFQKLRYFALVAKVKEKPGYWLITWQGRDFLRKGHQVRERVQILHNKIQDRSARTVSVNQVLKVEPYWLVKDDFIAPRPAEAIEQAGLFEN